MSSKQNDRHIIWSDIHLDFEDWRADLEEQYPDLSEDELTQKMYEINSEYLGDERMNLNVQLSQPILVVADIGRWDGRYDGYAEIKTGNIKDCLYSEMDMRPAVELSYLDEETQRDIVDRIDETEAFPSHDQAIRIRKAFEAGEINYDKVQDIMAEEKPNQKPKFKFSFDRLKPYIPKDYNDRMAEDYVIKALEYYQKFLRKQREQAR